MKFTAVDLQAEPVLVQKLVSGFPDRKAAFWRKGFFRMRRAPAAGPGHPMAWLMGEVEAPSGALLSLPGLAVSSDATQTTQMRQINLSSWVVDDHARTSAFWMLRRATADRNAIYTDLTPSAAVRRMLTALGFTPVNRGIARIFTAQAASSPHAQYKVTEATIDRLPCLDDARLACALEHHRMLGCIVLAVDGPREGGSNALPAGKGASDDRRASPMVLLPRRRRGVVPVAEVVFMPSISRAGADLLAALPAVCAWLMRRGILFLEIECPIDRDLPVSHRIVNQQSRLARGPYDTSGIDHLYSELVYFGF